MLLTYGPYLSIISGKSEEIYGNYCLRHIFAFFPDLFDGFVEFIRIQVEGPLIHVYIDRSCSFEGGTLPG